MIHRNRVAMLEDAARGRTASTPPSPSATPKGRAGETAWGHDPASAGCLVFGRPGAATRLYAVDAGRAAAWPGGCPTRTSRGRDADGCRRAQRRRSGAAASTSPPRPAAAGGRWGRASCSPSCWPRRRRAVPGPRQRHAVLLQRRRGRRARRVHAGDDALPAAGHGRRTARVGRRRRHVASTVDLQRRHDPRALPGRARRPVPGGHPGRGRGPLASGRRRFAERPHPREAHRGVPARRTPDRVPAEAPP